MTLVKSLKRLEEMGLVEITDPDGPYPRSYRVRFDRMQAIGNADAVPAVRKRTRRAA